VLQIAADPDMRTTTSDPVPRNVGDAGVRRRSSSAAPWEHDRRGALGLLVDDLDAFRRHVWGQRPHLSRAGTAATARTSLFTLDDVDDLLTSAARWPTVRMVAGGDVLTPSSYCTPVRLGGRDLDDVVDPAKVMAQINEGATLVLQSLHRTWPTIGGFVRELQAELSHPVQANAYLTPTDASGLAEHADVHDVFAVQLHGSKQWWVDGLGDLTMMAGDVVYIPRGTRHSAQTTSGASLHLTIGVVPVTYAQVLERCLRRNSAVLDRPLPVGYRHDVAYDELVEGVASALDQVLEIVGVLDIEDVATHELARGASRPAERGRISSLVLVDSLTGGDAIRTIAPDALGRAIDDFDAACTNWDGLRDRDEWAHEPERISVRVGPRTIGFPSQALPALRRLSTGASTLIDDLPDLDASSRLVVARRLVREGVCVIG
jgi:mannose-6-phosphate isomerase-like protein (cupin superfamily)